MKYILKVTAVGVDFHLFRVVSVDGKDDTEHVLNLINLSFDYNYYSSKSLYFANTPESMDALGNNAASEDADHYGPVDDLLSSFFKQDIEVNKGSFKQVNLERMPLVAYDRFDNVIEAERERLQSMINDAHPADNSRRFKFVYQVNELRHLIEVMTSSEDLKCFIPATIMGGGMISDIKGSLSARSINRSMRYIMERGIDDMVRIDECNARLSAFEKARNEENKEQSELIASIPALKFKFLEIKPNESDTSVALDLIYQDEKKSNTKRKAANSAVQGDALSDKKSTSDGEINVAQIEKTAKSEGKSKIRDNRTLTKTTFVNVDESGTNVKGEQTLKSSDSRAVQNRIKAAANAAKNCLVDGQSIPDEYAMSVGMSFVYNGMQGFDRKGANTTEGQRDYEAERNLYELASDIKVKDRSSEDVISEAQAKIDSYKNRKEGEEVDISFDYYSEQ